ncbi:MAG: 3-deoxy-7-phosphoheptulonate synthase [Clostridiales bacterium]|jgi:3-deoxy-7-phosphoheptulonate synthase|nr:3-deoxy-7-phosphoheptulonate synthase [Clostridiales bacterium]
MILIIKNGADARQYEKLTEWIEELGLKIHLSKGESTTVMGLVGDTSRVDTDVLRSLDIVKDILRVSEPYKKVNRKFRPDDTVIEVAGQRIGGGNFTLIAGPCSVESEKQIIEVAEAVKKAGAHFLRGGAFKPRTSPYSFQGLGADGLKLLIKAKAATGLAVVTEIMDSSQLDLFADVDIIQVGARNMQNFELLKKLGAQAKPVLLKRGFAATIEEWLMSAEYVMSGGNENVILCERGIRTFEPYTRNTLDLSAIPLVKELTHLPVIVDPSHASGLARLVEPMSLASAAAGADGLIIEVHNDPARALCDGAQSITPDKLAALVKKLDVVLGVTDKRRGL